MNEREGLFGTVSGIAFFGGMISMFAVSSFSSFFDSVQLYRKTSLFSVLYPILLTIHTFEIIFQIFRPTWIFLKIIIIIITLVSAFLFWKYAFDNAVEHAKDSSLNRMIIAIEKLLPMKLFYVIYPAVAITAIIGALIFPVIGITFTLISWQGWLFSFMGITLGIKFIKLNRFGKKAPIFDKLFK